MLTFSECEAKFNKSRSGRPKLENHTYLEKINDDTFGVCLHRTNVVLVHRNGNYTLNSGRWRTNTTKNRICSYSPANVCQKNFDWFIAKPGDWKCVQTFEDGVIVDGNGNVTDLAECDECHKHLKPFDLQDGRCIDCTLQAAG